MASIHFSGSSSGTFGAGIRPFRIWGDRLPTNRPLSVSLTSHTKAFSGWFLDLLPPQNHIDHFGFITALN